MACCRQAIFWHYQNQWCFIVNWTIRTKFQENFNANTAVHEIDLKMPSAKWQLFCFGLNLLNAAYFVVCDWMLIRWLQPVLLLRVLFPVGYLPASWHNRSPEQLRKTGVRRVAQSDFLKKKVALQNFDPAIIVIILAANLASNHGWKSMKT